MVDSTYGVLFKHAFLPELFLGDFSQINEAFHVLAHKDCLRDLIYSGATDFQLHHPQFWRHTIDRLHSNEERLALRRVLRKHGIRYDEFDPESSLRDFERGAGGQGTLRCDLVNDLVKELRPQSLRIGQPFIKNLGRLYVCRAAIPFTQRKCAFTLLSFRDLKGYGFEGLEEHDGTRNYSKAHIPLTVNIRKRCDVRFGSSPPNCLDIENTRLRFYCHVRVHIFPYGLTTAYFTYSAVSRQPVEPNVLSAALRLVGAQNSSISLSFGDNSFTCVTELLDFVIGNVIASIYRNPEKHKPHCSRLLQFQSFNLNTSYLQTRHPDSQTLLKLFALDRSDRSYNATFLRRYPSLLGKYRGDFAFCSSERLFMSLSVEWPNYRKTKTRVRYYWLFVHLFQFLTATKYLTSALSDLITKPHADADAFASMPTELAWRCREWIAFTSSQHKSLNPVYRRFFHKIHAIEGLKESLAALKGQIDSNLDSPMATSEIHASEIHEFRSMTALSDEASSDWIPHMQQLPEDAVKRCICEILGDEPRKDWGGEWSDHFSMVHINGRRYKASFLFKGPSRFREMKPSDLGKNADQIYRLSATPCDVMIIQHCHRIGEAVRATVHAFAALNPLRKYCLIDGKDTFRLLKAYGKL